MPRSMIIFSNELFLSSDSGMDHCQVSEMKRSVELIVTPDFNCFVAILRTDVLEN